MLLTLLCGVCDCIKYRGRDGFVEVGSAFAVKLHVSSASKMEIEEYYHNIIGEQTPPKIMSLLLTTENHLSKEIPAVVGEPCGQTEWSRR